VKNFRHVQAIPPIYQTTAFDLHGVEQLEAVVSGSERGYIYTRDGNPNHSAFAQDVATLEHTDAGAVCASGDGVPCRQFCSAI